jgi:hypothetical protein
MPTILFRRCGALELYAADAWQQRQSIRAAAVSNPLWHPYR